MNYRKILEYLYSQLPAYHRIGKPAYKDNLLNSIILDDHFNHPHKRYMTIHVAGTNGKGSVSHMLASVIREAGYKTGLYTSPHLKDFRERIRINGSKIPKNEVISFVMKNRDLIKEVSPSFFEITVAMAFDYFAREGVEVAVIETGMGGRLDSTNIIGPVLSVITNIGHDHMEFLGNTLGRVASEKAGIIKHNVPVVIGESHEETKKVFIDRASETASGIAFADENFSCRLGDYTDRYKKRYFSVSNLVSGKAIEGITSLPGDYQEKNIQTIFQCVDLLGGMIKISEKNLIDGIRNTVLNTGLQGRWQILKNKPLIICDTGHNKEGLESVLNQLKKVPNTGLHLVLGFVNDKDTDSILPLFPVEAKYYFTRASVPRALDENILRMRAEGYSLYGKSFPSVRKALKAAVKEAQSSDLIFIGGSTFVVAEVI